MKKRYIIAVFFIGLLLIAGLSVEYTSRPQFCRSCHYMEPYVESWEKSTHSDVTCTDCHFPPGLKSKLKKKFTAISMTVNYFTGVYKKSKPWAEITDSSCLRSGCHVERLLEGRVLFKEGIIFYHEPHLINLRREKKLRCTSCHSQIVQGEHITVTESTCFLCHFKHQPEDMPIDDCTWCHEAPISSETMEVKYDHGFVLDQNIECQKCHGPMQVGDGAVPIERCSSCHAEVEKIEKYDDTVFIHKEHVTDHKVECQNCHLVIQHKSISRTAEIMPECVSCHDKPHQVQLDLFSGIGGKNIPPHPNPMFDKGLNCQACHIFHQSENGFPEMGETLVAKAESCEKCHGEGYVRIVEQWKTLMTVKIDLLGNVFEVVEKEIASEGISDEVRRYALTFLEDASFNFQLVKQGNIVHNVAYSDELLFSAHDYLGKALKAINSTTSIPDISVYSKLVPSECKNCHYGQEEIDVQVFGVSFSHNIHIVKNRLLCSKCHSNMRKHGELVISRKECLSCHHTQEELHCVKCHELQAQIFDGSVGFATEILPDVMYEEGVECFSCHEGIEEPIEKAKKEKCSECHDPEYEELFMEWQSETTVSIEKISNQLDYFETIKISQKNKLKIDKIMRGLHRIEKDGSKGVHNIVLTEKTLTEYQNILYEIQIEVGQ
ncbi:MAG: cytochrome c3 family protein [Candidatus Marinimicrobia bacterium]|nr:cytochrome c3 family protein [Candidatus Neomarinimicrobiota bacterium]